jgi:hypothetical protein
MKKVVMIKLKDQEEHTLEMENIANKEKDEVDRIREIYMDTDNKCINLSKEIERSAVLMENGVNLKLHRGEMNLLFKGWLNVNQK